MLPTAHPWHGVDPAFQPPDLVDALIEIPRGSRAKYEADKATGLLRLDRVLYASVYYPVNYGFVPRTLVQDGDPLDVLVISLADIAPLTLVRCRIVGLMRMADSGVPDDKLLSVALADPSVQHCQDIGDVPEYLCRELKNFFEEYKKLEGRQTLVDGFLGREAALPILQEALQRYRGKFSQT